MFFRSHIPVISVFLLLVLLAGCAPRKAIREEGAVCYPYDLKVETNDRQMTVIWKLNCNRLMSGYNVYINEEPPNDKYPGQELSSSIKPFNPTPYPGDTNPEDELVHFVAESLDNGVKYYVSVRVVNPDRTLSKPSNEITAVCGPKGEIELSIRFKSEQDGFFFEKNSYVRADDIDNDLYFYSRDGQDYLVSPNQLDGFLKANRLSLLPFKGEFEHVKTRLLGLNDLPSQNRVAVTRGDWIHIFTSDNKHALVYVLDISGKGERRSIRLFYAYSPLPHEPLF